MAGKLIYGGSFNPIHIGHLRLAIEVSELLGNFVDSVDFVPSAHPPHKTTQPMLPVELRSRMVKAALAGQKHMKCNDLESMRSGPSYTVDTLRDYGRLHSAKDLYFLLGSVDYALLPAWYKGLCLPELCNLVIVPRGAYGIADFMNTTKNFWKEAVPESGAHSAIGGGSAILTLDNGARIFYLPVPYLEISASRIRQLWLEGRDIAYLVPEVVIEILNEKKQAILDCWQEKDVQCSV